MPTPFTASGSAKSAIGLDDLALEPPFDLAPSSLTLCSRAIESAPSRRTERKTLPRRLATWDRSTALSGAPVLELSSAEFA